MLPHYAAGNYGVIITAQRLSKTTNGHYQVLVSFRPYSVEDLTGPEKAWAGLPGDDPERTTYMVITEKSVGYVCRKLTQIGITVSDWEHVDQDSPHCCSAIGKKVLMKCEHSMYKEEMREQWEVPLESEIKPLDAMEVSELNALYGAALKGAQVVAQQAEQEPAQPAQGDGPPEPEEPPDLPW